MANYFYIANRNRSTDKSSPQQPKKGTSYPESEISSIIDTENPIFNFNPLFIKQLENISPIELAQVVPFISLKATDESGRVIEDYNLRFFHDPINIENISKTDERWVNRPNASLRSLEAKTTQASGYMYYTEVTLGIRIHRQNAFNGTLLGLLFPGMPLLLEYGWKGDGNSFLTKTQSLRFAVRTYNLTFDTSGQADLSLIGLAFNDKFNNLFLGDGAQETSGDNATAQEQGGLQHSEERIKQWKKIYTEKSVGNNMELVRAFLESLHKPAEQKTRDIWRANFKNRLKNLRSKRDKEKGLVTFHDVVKTLCDETFNAMEKRIFPREEKGGFRVIYGHLNSDAGKFANTSIADFPIKFKILEEYINSQTKIKSVITVENLFNFLTAKFVENSELYKENDKKKNKTKDLKESVKLAVNVPNVAINLFNHSVDDKKDTQRFVDLSIIDVDRDIPVTSKGFPSKGKASLEDIRKEVLKDSALPVIRFGHANSFIKEISLSHIVDEHMKAVLISRIYEKDQKSEREPVTNKKRTEEGVRTESPLFLPLKGTMVVVGHVDWKPFRSFYLSTGNVFMDGVYKILDVAHRLSAEGFTTSIEFMRH